MFKHIFDNEQNMAIYPVFSLLVFFTFFVGVSVWVVRISKKHAEEMSQLPLDEKDGESFNG